MEGTGGIMLSEINKTKTKYHMSRLYMESKNKPQNKQNKLIDTDNWLVIARGRGLKAVGKRNGRRKSKGENFQLF